MTITAFLITLLLPLLVFILWNLICLYRNYRLAKSVKVPIIILIASPDNPVWLLACRFVLPIIEAVYGECDITRYGWPEWIVTSRSQMHEELGDVVIHVSAARNWLYVCNAGALNDIYRRNKEFDRPPDLLAVLGVFGPNISTAVGADWQRQRKVTSAPFNDQNYAVAWTESLRLGSEMLQFWTSSASPIRTTARDTRTYALDVLSGAGFGKSYPFQKSTLESAPAPGRKFNYGESIGLVLHNALFILIFGPKFLARVAQIGWPGSWARIGQATVDFKFYMTEMLQEERAAIAAGKTQGSTITHSLLKASQEMAAAPKENGSQSRVLTEEEVYGNIFVFNFAGHDTTATVLNWALYLLAAYPDVQDWISEEITTIIPDEGLTGANFKDIYPKLNRCSAILYETLRLLNPLIGICKSTFDHETQLTVDGRDLIIPADTRVSLSTYAIHSHPRHWGADRLLWRPSRWIVTSGSESSLPAQPIPGSKSARETSPAEKLEKETIFMPEKGTYIPWSEGMRTCPGKKFSQIEIIGAMVALFRGHRVQVVPENGESDEMARQRALKTVNDNVIVLLLQMRNPEDVGLRWVEKK